MPQHQHCPDALLRSITKIGTQSIDTCTMKSSKKTTRRCIMNSRQKSRTKFLQEKAGKAAKNGGGGQKSSMALASSVTSSLSTTTQFSASMSIASSAYPHPASSLLFARPLLVLLAISRFKPCGVRSRRRVLTCRMMRGPLLLLTIWLDVAEMLRSTPLTLG
jgi:hypothetical protein